MGNTHTERETTYTHAYTREHTDTEKSGRHVAGTYAGIGTLEEVEVKCSALRLWVAHKLRVGLHPDRALREEGARERVSEGG